GTGAGYPRYAHRPGPEEGYKNLAVFLGACSFDCLYCQNSAYHEMTHTKAPLVTPEELADAVDDATSCICFFGGDPSPQMPFALRAAKLAREKAKGRILRICWETNGNLHPRYLPAMLELSLQSGGCIKFDLKAWDENLHLALTGADGRQARENFRYLARHLACRPEPPLLVASTLLVPGYVGVEEVSALAGFLAETDPCIPYTLLAFSPQHLMRDLPHVARAEAEACLQAAKAAGLERVRLGNFHLLR
ncbi:MAG: radical SAM protein, partial [Moorellales bacterium]